MLSTGLNKKINRIFFLDKFMDLLVMFYLFEQGFFDMSEFLISVYFGVFLF